VLVERVLDSGPYDNYIQIDAPINKGNSGGLAFDINGNVIGVNTAIYSPSGGSVGIGFDVPARTAKAVIAQLKDKGVVTRVWLGVQVQPVTTGIADSLGMKKVEGAMVDEPQNGSPAAKAGVQSGDVVTALNGTPVKDSRDLARWWCPASTSRTLHAFLRSLGRTIATPSSSPVNKLLKCLVVRERSAHLLSCWPVVRHGLACAGTATFYVRAVIPP
jgi:hypothetical protein